ncbi:MAG: type II secretion system protein GspK [Verrucomicrobiales bacterium]|nr:type II secretion system protein GspK [Verrucomicrobiales bacterium]
MRHLPKSHAKERGMALLLVLVVVMALTLIVGTLWQTSQPGWEQNTRERAEHQAGLIAESGISVAMHPAVEPGDFALRHELAPGRSFEVLITSESGRFPVNNLADENWRAALLELFLRWGMDLTSASRAADSLADWVDPDDDPNTNGAENSFYARFEIPEFPTNGPFTSLEEMLFVAGMDDVARIQPMWRDYFTIYSDSLVDLNAAPWELVAAMTGATDQSAQNFVAVRNGDDGIEGTIDDYRTEDVGEVQALLGLSDSEWSEVSSRVSLFGGIVRFESTGRIGEFDQKRIVLAQQSGTGQDKEYVILARFRE